MLSPFMIETVPFKGNCKTDVVNTSPSISVSFD